MKHRNIYTDVTSDLQFHEDERGKIADLFYNKPIQHIAFITIKNGAIRGNHYHKETIQHIFLIKGSLEYWYKPMDSNEKPRMMKISAGETATSEQMEIHALRATEDSEFIALAEGIRGGKDYEKDTFRVKTIVPEGNAE